MDGTFVSYAQNGEDVLLWRALGHIPNGRYVDVGAADPDELSVTKALYERGWRGVDVDASSGHATSLRRERPDDVVLHVAVTDSTEPTVVFHEIHYRDDGRLTGLSTLDSSVAAGHIGGSVDGGADGMFDEVEVVVPTMRLSEICADPILGGVIHFLKVDVEGAEAAVLRSMDFSRHRPWVVVVEATAPLSTTPTEQDWEPLLLNADYEFVLFDGLSRFYVATEHAELKPALSYPVCVFDEYRSVSDLRFIAAATEMRDEAAQKEQALWADLVHWRAATLDAMAELALERGRSRDELEAMRKLLRRKAVAHAKEQRRLRARLKSIESSTSWKVTRPIRGFRSRLGRRDSSGNGGR